MPRCKKIDSEQRAGSGAPTQEQAMNAQDFGKAVGVEQIETAVKNGQETAAKIFKAGKETAQKFYKAGSDAYAKGYEKATAMAREQVEKTWPQAVTKFDEAAALAKENLDAAFAAQAVAQKGFDAISDEVTALGKKTAEAQFANVKALFGVKSPQEFVELQTAIVRTAFDSAVAGSTKVAEIVTKVANETAEPVQTRVTKVMEKYGKPLAA
jgi:phasin family protein